MRLRNLPAVLLLLGTATAPFHLNAQAASAASAPQGMTNADVVALVGAGLPDEIIIAKIHAAPSTAFDTSATGLTALKKANTSTAVIRVMIDPHPSVAANPAAAGPPVAAVGNPDDPETQHAPGLYTLVHSAGEQTHMTRLQAETPRGVQSNGVFVHVITRGIAPSKVQQVLDGAKAATEIPDPKPVFYAYIPDYSGSFTGGMGVKDLVLTRLEVKGDTRLWTFASHGLIGGSNEIGNDQKARQGFTSEEIKPGIYKLTPAADLPAGQYAFKYSSSYFDFGIQPQS